MVRDARQAAQGRRSTHSPHHEGAGCFAREATRTSFRGPRPRRASLPLCQLLQRREITANERFLLGAAPSLQPSLVFNCIRDLVEPLRENEFDRSTRGGVTLKGAVAVLSYSDFERCPGRSDVVAAVGTPEYVKPGSFSHPGTRLVLRDAARRRAAPTATTAKPLRGDQANHWRTKFKKDHRYRRLEGWPRDRASPPSFETHRFAMLLRMRSVFAAPDIQSRLNR